MRFLFALSVVFLYFLSVAYHFVDSFSKTLIEAAWAVWFLWVTSIYVRAVTPRTSRRTAAVL